MYTGLIKEKNSTMPAHADHTELKKLPRDLRYRRQFFPEAEGKVFDVAEKGFVPVPIILRKLIRHVSAPELRVLMYLYLRASRYGICYPTYDEIVYELGLMGKKNLLPHLKSLEDKRFIATHTTAGRTFFLIYDPRVAITHLNRTGDLSEHELAEINDLYADLNQNPIPPVNAESRSNEDVPHV